jgi:hypothetical protein
MAVSINEFLAEKSINVVPQPPYSPDLSPCDFFYSPGPHLVHTFEDQNGRKCFKNEDLISGQNW